MAEEGEPPEGQPPLRILYHAMLGRAGAVVRMCEEKGQPYEFISDFPELAKVCGAFGAAESGTFAPPVVQDGDVTVSQSGACTMYIGEKLGLSAGVPNAAVAMQHLCDIGDWVVECGNAFSAIKELAPEEAVQSLRAFAQKRFVQWVAVLEQSIVGPFYYGAEATYVDYFLVSSVDWLQEVWLKGLPVWETGCAKIMAVVASIRALASYADYAGPLKTVRDGFPTLAPEIVALWSSQEAGGEGDQAEPEAAAPEASLEPSEEDKATCSKPSIDRSVQIEELVRLLHVFKNYPNVRTMQKNDVYVDKVVMAIRGCSSVIKARQDAAIAAGVAVPMVQALSGIHADDRETCLRACQCVLGICGKNPEAIAAFKEAGAAVVLETIVATHKDSSTQDMAKALALISE